MGERVDFGIIRDVALLTLGVATFGYGVARENPELVALAEPLFGFGIIGRGVAVANGKLDHKKASE